jgi:hypothetical protein
MSDALAMLHNGMLATLDPAIRSLLLPDRLTD